MLGQGDTLGDKEGTEGGKGCSEGRGGMVLKDPRPGAYGLGAGRLLQQWRQEQTQSGLRAWTVPWFAACSRGCPPSLSGAQYYGNDDQPPRPAGTW